MSERGTYNWMAPELIRGDPVSEKCDIYSFAMVLYEMLAKKIPYRKVGFVKSRFLINFFRLTQSIQVVSVKLF